MRFNVQYTVPMSVTVEVDADDRDDASNKAWDMADEYLKTIYGDNRNVTACAILDGIGADSVEEIVVGPQDDPRAAI